MSALKDVQSTSKEYRSNIMSFRLFRLHNVKCLSRISQTGVPDQVRKGAILFYQNQKNNGLFLATLGLTNA